jgi:large subunit ribosomal protein L25
MENITLKAEARELEGRATNALRDENIVPAVVYGAGEEPVNIKVSRSDFDRTYRQAGESTVVNLELDGKTIPTLIHDVQFDPRTDFSRHADFLRIDMNKPVETAVALSFVGEAPAVEVQGGMLITSLEEVEVRALPTALVREIEVDISTLATFDDAIHVSDIKAPEGVEILTDMELTVATAQPPRSEEEMEDLDAPVEGDVDAVEVSTEKKEEEEASEESAE